MGGGQPHAITRAISGLSVTPSKGRLERICQTLYTEIAFLVPLRRRYVPRSLHRLFEVVFGPHEEGGWYVARRAAT